MAEGFGLPDSTNTLLPILMVKQAKLITGDTTIQDHSWRIFNAVVRSLDTDLAKATVNTEVWKKWME